MFDSLTRSPKSTDRDSNRRENDEGSSPYISPCPPVSLPDSTGNKDDEAIAPGDGATPLDRVFLWLHPTAACPC